MKPTLLTAFSLLAASSVYAQFSLQPQFGFEQSRTALTYGSGPAASNSSGNLKAGLKIDYRLKGGHSPFINLTTTPAPVSFAFDNAGTLVNSFQSSTPKLMLQAGYGYSSKAIRLGKGGAPKNTPGVTQENRALHQHGCGMYRSRCGERRAAKTNAASQPLNLRLQPSLALAYVPSATQTLSPKNGGLEYTAANWKTALVPSMGFEFAKGQQRLFTLNLFYTKPLAQSSNAATLSMSAKAVPVSLLAKTSSWGMTIGIPFGFAKTAQPKTKAQNRPTEKIGGCHRNYHRCMRFQEN